MQFRKEYQWEKGGEANQGFTVLKNNKIVTGPSRKEKRIKIPPSRVTKIVHEDHIMRLLLKGNLSTGAFICGKKNT